MDIGERIKNEREQQQLSREELAEAIGKSADFIGKVERGARRISVEDLARVAKALGQGVEFFTGEGEEPEVERELDRLMESAKLDPRDKIEIQRLPRLRSKEAVMSLAKSLQAGRFGLFRLREFEIRIEVLPDGGAQRWWRRRIEVLDSELPELKVGYVTTYDLRSTSDKFTVDLLPDRCWRQGGGEIKMRDEDKYVAGNHAYYSIRFEPPLQRGEITEVTCTEFSPGAYVMTSDELQQLIKQRMFREEEPRERTVSGIIVPIDLLTKQLTFPRGYKIHDIDIDVLVGRMRLNDERERIKKEKCLSAMDVFSRRVLELKLNDPVVGAAYHITWRPPTEEDYKKLLCQERKPRAATGGTKENTNQ